MHRLTAATLLAAALGLAVTLGCYANRPLAGAPPAPGQRVRLQLTDSGSRALRANLGDSVVAVTGRLISRTPAALELAVSSTETPTGGIKDWDGEPVAVPTSLVATTQDRRLSPLRTGLLAAAIVAAAFLLREGLDAVNGASGGGRGPPEQQ